MNPSQKVFRDHSSSNRQANHCRRHDKKAKLACYRATFRKVAR
jgi:hypothetical protein